jgi:hypothetical protein
MDIKITSGINVNEYCMAALRVKSKNAYYKHLNKENGQKIIVCGGTVVELWRMNSKHLQHWYYILRDLPA